MKNAQKKRVKREQQNRKIAEIRNAKIHEE